ncbi:MAG: HicB family protein [Firmicutes bacterium]|nr:HicB family protein [Bacillota bacterium]
MKHAYPIILTPSKSGFVVYVPDFNINTQGKDIPEAMFMARDAIGLIGIDMQDDGEDFPVPSDCKSLSCEHDETITLVDVDFDEYRRKNDNRIVKKNCSLPSWLNEAATAKGINFSATLQEALKAQLGL